MQESSLRAIIRESISKILKKEEALDIEALFHFSQISETELKAQYVDLSASVASNGYGGKFMY